MANLFDFKKGIFLIFAAGMGIIRPGAAQSPESWSATASYDTSAIAELFTTIPVGFTFISSKGTTISTRGWLNGSLRWRNLDVTTKQGTLNEGQLTYSRQKVWDNQHRVTFEIKWKGATLTANLPLPFVQKIRFNLYTDSLKRNNPFYLNVEGKFSNGRIYPLDTGMVAFCKKKGVGILKGNILDVSDTDTSAHFAIIETWLKTDSSLRDCTKIPVKILPDPSSLPTEQQLLNKWEKRH